MSLTLPPRVHSVGVSLHPAFALRSGAPQFLPLITTATLRAQRWATLEAGPVRDFDIRVEPLVEDALKAIQAAKVVAIDVETPMGDPTTITIVGIATDERTAFVWPWRDAIIPFVGEVLADKRVIKVGHNFAYDTRAFHRYGLDVAWPVVDTIQAAALLWPPFAEAKDRPWLRLPLCVTRIADGIPYWKEPETEQTKRLYRVLFPMDPEWQYPLLYCGLDCVMTWRLWAAQRTLLAKDGMLGLLEDVVAPAAPVLIRLKERGLPLDEARRKALQRDANKLILERSTQVQTAADEYHQRRLLRIQERIGELAEQEEAETDWMMNPPTVPCGEHPDYIGLTKRAKCSGCAAIYAVSGERRERAKEIRSLMSEGLALTRRLGPVFQTASDDSWRWLLFDRATGLGLKPTAYTDRKRTPKVDADVIEALQRKHPDIEVLKWRVDMQHAGRRLSNVLGVETEADGCVHFTYTMHRTETGRIASGADDAEPDKWVDSPGNAQNIPERDRVIYSPLSPSRVFVQADWSQIEARVMAWLAEERGMLEAFRRGDDLHSLNAAALFGCGPTKAAAEAHLVRFGGAEVSARHAAKRATHGWDYGLGALKTARMYGIKVAEAAALIEAYFQRWPKLRAFQNRVVADVEAVGSLRNPFGRLLRFHNFRKNAAGGRTLVDREEALAFLPQSTVGDMCKAVLPVLDRIEAPGGVVLRATCHDSFLFECEMQDVAVVVQEARRIMERQWEELGCLDGFGVFSCPADIAVGRNWWKWSPSQNPEGLRGWAPAGAASATPSAAAL